MDTETLLKEGPHKFFGIELNQLTWSLLTKADRTSEEDQMMIHAAHGSYFHWKQEGTGANKANYQRGEWLISHVYSVLNIPERAIHYALRCNQMTDDNLQDMQDFDIAYSCEAMARAHACNGNKEECLKYFNLAEEKGSLISDPEAKQYFISDLNSGPWFGLKSV
jgi:hypothetical protein